MYSMLWDYVMSEANRGKDCMYPEVPRTKNFGDTGSIHSSFPHPTSFQHLLLRRSRGFSFLGILDEHGPGH